MAGWAVVAKVQSCDCGEYFSEDVTIVVSADNLAQVHERASAYLKSTKDLDADEAVIKSAKRVCEVVIGGEGRPV